MQPIIYLAGPITGLDYGSVTNWRVDVKDKLERMGYKALSPMRDKEILKDEKNLSGTFEQYGHILTQRRSVMARDYNDCRRCDLLFVNFLGAKDKSLGTTMEIAWAYARQVPIIAVMETSKNPHEHGMILEALDFRVQTLDEAIFLCRTVLG